MNRGALAAVLWLLAASGCATHRIAVAPALAAAEAVVQPVPVDLRVEGVHVLDGGRMVPAADAFVNRIVMELRRTRAFAHVLPPRADGGAGEDAVRLHVQLLGREDLRIGANVGKAVAVGVSLLLLAPLVEFEAGYEAELRAIATTCDGWQRFLRGSASGEARYRFGAREGIVERELIDSVIARSLDDLSEQVARDAELRERVGALRREGDCRKTVLEE